jgi:ferritin-like metal-binding protein YciE
MAMQDPKELFVKLLSDLRQNEEKTTNILQELGDAVEDPDIKEAIESRVFLKNQTLSTLDQCFKLIGEKPVKVNDRLHDIFVEDFRRELAAIESPLAKILYIVAKANHLMHLRMGEYVALIAMADVTTHYGVGMLLESCLADNRAFIERTRRRIREMVETEVTAGVV